MVVIPERAHPFARIAARRPVRIVVIAKSSGIMEIAWKSIALAGAVTVVQMRGNRRQPKSDVVRRQIVPKTHQNRLTVAGLNRQPGKYPAVSPTGGRRQVGMKLVLHLLHVDVVENLRSKLRITLMIGWIGPGG